MYAKVSAKTFKKSVFLYICAAPFLGSYSNSFIVYLSIILLLGYNMLEYYKGTVLPKAPFLFFIWCIIVTAFMDLIVVDAYSTSINRSIAFVLYVFTVITLSKDKDVHLFLRFYVVFAHMALAFFIVQVLFYYILHMAIMFQIPFLDLNENLHSAYNYLNTARTIGVLFPRFPGPFSEPSIYADYLAPLLLLYLYGTKDIKKNNIAAGIIVVTLFLSTSGVGIIMACVSIGLYIWLKNSKDRKKALWIPVLAFILFAAVLAVYVSSGRIRETINTLFVPGTGDENSKADYRIYRGIYYFLSLPVIYKVMGIGLFNAENFALQNHLVNPYDADTSSYEYFNGISQTFIYTGIIGTIIFCLFLMKIVPRKSMIEKAFFVLYLMLIVGTSYLFTEMAVIYLALAYIVRQEGDEKT